MNVLATARNAVKHASYNLLTATIGDEEGMVTLPVISGPAKGLSLRLDLVKRKEAYVWGKYDRQSFV